MFLLNRLQHLIILPVEIFLPCLQLEAAFVEIRTTSRSNLFELKDDLIGQPILHVEHFCQKEPESSSLRRRGYLKWYPDKPIGRSRSPVRYESVIDIKSDNLM